ncbi:MAG: hypothetical protein J0M08_05770 [Bacteroidetes bacterium]|nr:hypothetical protein [Bacteroidota bacterium]
MSKQNSFLIPCLCVFCTLSMFFISCKKEAGEGGAATITGKIYVKDYDNATLTNLESQYFAQKEDVYIIYGGEKGTFDDRVETSYDGTYEFKFLRKGKYKIFVYSKDISKNLVLYPSGYKTEFYSVEISGKKDEVEVPTIEIID